MKADRASIKADGRDLSFVTVTVADKDGLLVPRSKNRIRFEIRGRAKSSRSTMATPPATNHFRRKNETPTTDSAS